MKNATIDFIASVNDERITDIKKIAARLKKMGCNIDNVLAFSGIITGSASSNISIEDLKIDGIKNVELSRNVKAIARQ